MKQLIPFLAICAISSCVKDRTPAPVVIQASTDTLVHYNPTVKQFVDNYCIQCHDNTTGIPLHDYAHVKAFAVSGDLIGSITGNPNYTKMPPDVIIPDNEIQQVVKWANEGCPE